MQIRPYNSTATIYKKITQYNVVFFFFCDGQQFHQYQQSEKSPITRHCRVIVFTLHCTTLLICLFVCFVVCNATFNWNIIERRVWRYKGVIKIRKSRKNRQHNGQKKKYERTNNDLQNITNKIRRVTLNPGDELRCAGRVSSVCYISGTHLFRTAYCINHLQISPSRIKVWYFVGYGRLDWYHGGQCGKDAIKFI